MTVDEFVRQYGSGQPEYARPIINTFDEIPDWDQCEELYWNSLMDKKNQIHPVYGADINSSLMDDPRNMADW